MFDLNGAMEVYDEMKRSGELDTVVKFPTLDECLDGNVYPPSALIFGWAHDGMPTMLNLLDPNPRAILVAGDDGCGKTNLLRLIAAAGGRTHSYEDVQFGVVTSHPEDWDDLFDVPNVVGIFPTYKDDSENFIQGVAAWAHGNKHSKQSVVILLDDIEVAVSSWGVDTLNNLRWLLFRGAPRRVWTFATVNSLNVKESATWMSLFPTRIFGKVSDRSQLEKFGVGDMDFSDLQHGSEFSMKEGSGWLKFFIPEL